MAHVLAADIGNTTARFGLLETAKAGAEAPQSFSAHARSPRASPSRQTRRACSLGRFSAS